jgi:hypothetical protein
LIPRERVNGMKHACECESPEDNYEESADVLWRKPTEYNMDRHGPPYLPPAGVKLSSDQKKEARAFVKQAKTDLRETVKKVMASDPNLTPWTVLLGYLQALSLLHQTHHWNTSGGDFYGDHLLFERVYNSASEGIDSVAERAVGKGMPPMINPQVQAHQMCGILKGLNNRFPEACYVELSLQGELMCLSLIDIVMAQLKAVGQLSSGDSNLLEGIADAHETLVYLLKQRFSGTPESKPTTEAYTYDRQ